VDRWEQTQNCVSILFEQVFIVIQDNISYEEEIQNVSILFKQVFIAIHYILQGVYVIVKERK